MRARNPRAVQYDVATLTLRSPHPRDFMKLLATAALLTLTTACAGTPSPAKSPPEVGSERGSVVALEVTDETGTLRYLTSALEDNELVELALLAPNVEVVAGLDEQERLARAAEFDAVDAHLLTPEFLAAATRLRWAQSWSAGVDRYIEMGALMENDDIVLTNMKGVHGPVIAEHVMAMLLSMSRALPAFQRAQDKGEWDRRAGTGQRALSGSTLLVVGMGGIGTEVARRAHGFDMRVLATVRSKREAPEFVAELGTTDDLTRFLGEADVVVICVPLTDATRGMFDAQRLAQMKPDAILINIARGPVVDTDALLAALESGALGGACLDVTDPEPLPAGHPLWSRDDVIITPHTAGVAELTGTRRGVLFRENLRRFGAGEPLLNVVDKTVGY